MRTEVITKYFQTLTFQLLDFQNSSDIIGLHL